MKYLFIYFVGMLITMMIPSFVPIAAQDGNELLLNNIILNNTSLSNASLNLLNDSSADLDANPPLKVGSEDNATFNINSNVIVMPVNSTKINISNQRPGIQPPKRTIFIIDFVRPKSSASYENRSLQNGAYLSRKVEGTPHGYVTYYN